MEVPSSSGAPGVTAAPDHVEPSGVVPAETAVNPVRAEAFSLVAQMNAALEVCDIETPPPKSTKMSGARALKVPCEDARSVARPLTNLEQKLAIRRAKLNAQLVNLKLHACRFRLLRRIANAEGLKFDV